jgi:muramidase (phage lysozyme)
MRELLATVLLAPLAWFAWRHWTAAREVAQGDALPGLSFANVAEEVGGFVAGTDAGQAGEQNLAAFLLMIRHAEGTADPDGYRALFGHRADRPKLFAGFDDHPRIAARFTDRSGRQLWTSAAGAYQFLAVSPIPGGGSTRMDTWDRLKRKLALPDFSASSQDRAAVALIDEAGALADVLAGRVADAIPKVRGIWASLPGAGYDQPERRIGWLLARYADAGGALT